MTEPPGADKPERKVLAYVAGVQLCAIGILGSVWSRAGFASEVTPGEVLFWLALTLASELFWYETRSRDGMVSMSLSVNLATVFLLPPQVAILVAGLGTWVADLVIHRRGWLRSSFNGAQTAVAVAACVAAVRLLGGDPIGRFSPLIVDRSWAVVAAPLVFFVVNTSLVSAVIALHTGQSFRRAWWSNYGLPYQILSTVTLSLLGFLLVASVGSVGLVAGLSFPLLLLFVRDANVRYIEGMRDDPERAKAA